MVADDSVPAQLVAADLLAQAEHGPAARPSLVTWDEAVADAVDARARRARRRRRPRRDEIEATLADRRPHRARRATPAQAIDVVNLIAPEHLELVTADPDALLPLRAQRRRGVRRTVRRRPRSATTSPA